MKVNKEGKPLREFRCTNCRALLFYEYIFDGRVEVKCRNCNEVYNVDFKSARAELKRYKGGE